MVLFIPVSIGLYSNKTAGRTSRTKPYHFSKQMFRNIPSHNYLIVLRETEELTTRAWGPGVNGSSEILA